MTTELEFTRKVAECLGSGWEAVIAGDQVRLYKDGVERIFLRGDGWKWNEDGRVSVHGIYPQFCNRGVLSWYGENVCPHITCAISRGPAAVARDIERRFLPDFWHHVERAEKLVEQYTNDMQSRARNALDIAGVLGENIPSNLRDGWESQIKIRFGGYNNAPWGHVDVSKEDYTFEIRHCPVDLGLQIAQVIARHKGKAK